MTREGIPLRRDDRHLPPRFFDSGFELPDFGLEDLLGGRLISTWSDWMLPSNLDLQLKASFLRKSSEYAASLKRSRSSSTGLETQAVAPAKA